jgi:hypothetical protein
MKVFLCTFIALMVFVVPVFAQFTDDFEGGSLDPAWVHVSGTINISLNENHTPSGMFSMEGVATISQPAEAVRQETSATPGQTWWVEGWVWTNVANKVEFGWYDRSTAGLLSKVNSISNWVYVVDTITFSGADFDVDFYAPGIGTDAYLDDVATHKVINEDPTLLPPSYSNNGKASGLPGIKLYKGVARSNAFGLGDYNSGSVATTYGVVTNFAGAVSAVAGTGIVNVAAVNTVGAFYTTESASNTAGKGTGQAPMKWSTYIIKRLPTFILSASQFTSLNVFNYTSDSVSTPAGTLPATYGNISALVSSNSNVTVAWANNSTINIQSIGSFGIATITVKASPSLSPNSDIDKETIIVSQILNPNGSFSNATDTTVYGVENVSGTTSGIPTLSCLTTYSGASGVIKFTFSTLTAGIKWTLAPAYYVNTIPNQWYVIRMRLMTDATSGNDINYNVFHFNGAPPSPTDVSATVRLSTFTTWTWVESYLYSSLSTAYPQIQIKNRGTSPTNVYLDEIQLARLEPGTVRSYGTSKVSYTGGDFGSGDLSKRAFEAPVGSNIGSYNIETGLLKIVTPGSGAGGIKLTASTTGGQTVTTPTVAGRAVGVNAKISSTGLFVGNSFLVAVYGVDSPALAQPFSELGAAAQLLHPFAGTNLSCAHLAFSPNQYVQLQIKNSDVSTTYIDEAYLNYDMDADNSWGDPSLFGTINP